MAEAGSIGQGDTGLEFLCETLEKLKRSTPQKTSQTRCLVTGLQLQGRMFSS